MTTHGIEAGESCLRNGCNGMIEETEKKGCTCFSSPPCSACTEERAYCPICGWDAAEETRQYWAARLKAVEIKPVEEPKEKAMQKYRTTVEILQSGQKKAYGPTTRHVKVTFEQAFMDNDGKEVWKPCRYNIDFAKQTMQTNMHIGMPTISKGEGDWYQEYVSSFTPHDPRPAYQGSTTMQASVFEFTTYREYCD